MQVTQITEAPEETLLIRAFLQGQGPEQQQMFKGEKGEVWWYSSNELWLGLGVAPKLPAILKIFRTLFFTRKDRWPDRIILDARGFLPDWIEMSVNGVLLGGYNLQLYKSEPKLFSSFFGENGELLIWVNGTSEQVQQAIELATLTARVQMRIMDLMNAPSNYKTPSTLAEWAIQSGKDNGYKVTVLEKTMLESLKMNALLAVSKGSDKPPAMIIAEYKPENFKHTVTVVGKGVTFDTGGISIKPSANMHLMKSDMGGAAAALGIVELAAQLKLPIHLIGVIPTTENCVDGASMKPGDVIASYSGKTIEVIDTDAEGRLILADALSYAVRHYTTDILIDLATLTGSVIQTLGYEAAGLFTSNDELSEALTKAGEETGERLWRLPMWDDYKDEISSDIADLKNYHGKPLAGAIVAAKFLEVFTDQHPAWAHLDIAGTAFGEADFAPGRAGTAYGVRLLRKYLTTLAAT
jgi:leucyl aminopeptidase